MWSASKPAMQAVQPPLHRWSSAASVTAEHFVGKFLRELGCLKFFGFRLCGLVPGGGGRCRICHYSSRISSNFVAVGPPQRVSFRNVVATVVPSPLLFFVVGIRNQAESTSVAGCSMLSTGLMLIYSRYRIPHMLVELHFFFFRSSSLQRCAKAGY